eukprot:5720647-Pleurochrysis_carterae.AAC.5
MRAVNERRGPGTPEASRVLHTVVGIDRYPNYLQRFSPAELSQLEELFKKYAEQCAQAKAGILSNQAQLQCITAPKEGSPPLSILR